jgi:hypothetical protein
MRNPACRDPIHPVIRSNALGTKPERRNACCVAPIFSPIKAPDLPQTASKAGQRQFERRLTVRNSGREPAFPFA